MSELLLTFQRVRGDRLMSQMATLAERQGITQAEAARRLARALSEPVREFPRESPDTDHGLDRQDPEQDA